MDRLGFVENLAVVGFSVSLSLFAVAVRQHRGSPFGRLLVALSAAVALAVATTLVNVLPAAPSTGHPAIVAFGGRPSAASTSWTGAR